MLKATSVQQLSGKAKPTEREKELGFVKAGSCGYSGAKASLPATLKLTLPLSLLLTDASISLTSLCSMTPTTSIIGSLLSSVSHSL